MPFHPYTVEADEPYIAPSDRPWPRVWQGPFLHALSRIPDATAACRAAGISRKNAYEWRHRDSAFADAWLEALTIANDNIQRIAYQWATTGWPIRETRTVEKRDASGRVVETTTSTIERTERSVAMLIFWLKSWIPDRYRDRHEIGGIHGQPVQVQSLSELDAQIAQLTAELHQRGVLEAARKAALDPSLDLVDIDVDVDEAT